MNRPRVTARLLTAAAAMTMIALAPGCRQAPPPPAKPPAPEIRYVLPMVQKVTDFEDFTGRVEALKTVEVRARVTGYLERFLFDEGREVKEGDVLFEIDPRPYQATFDQSVAEVAQAKAQLAKAEADYSRTRGTYVRQASSQAELDLARAAHEEARASVGIAEAKRDQAQLNLQWTKVKAPISGQVSRRMVDPGNLVQADVTPLTTIVFAEQVYVNFDIDERTILKLRRLVREGKLQTRDQRQLAVYAALVDEDPEKLPHRGFVDFSDNRVDPGTGTLRLRGVFDNPALSADPSSKYVRRIMSPGLFARVRLPIGEPHDALMVPEKALGSDQGQKYVFVVKSARVKEKDPKTGQEAEVVKEKVERRDVAVGALHGKLRVIDSGLGPNDRVIVTGIQRIRNGMEVRPTPEPVDTRAEGQGDGKEKDKKDEAGKAGTPPPSGGQAAAPAKDQAIEKTAGPAPGATTTATQGPGARP